uniref:Uncharacterized protein n=1 Tax=Glossina austeni TaxID=7395 RepID=A0A1A9V9Z0_GLOAU
MENFTVCKCISCHNITNVFFMLPPHNTTTLTTAKTIAQQRKKCLCSACQHYYNHHHQLHHSPVHINVQKFCFYHSNHRNNHHRRHTHCGTLASINERTSLHILNAMLTKITNIHNRSKY